MKIFFTNSKFSNLEFFNNIFTSPENLNEWRHTTSFKRQGPTQQPLLLIFNTPSARILKILQLLKTSKRKQKKKQLSSSNHLRTGRIFPPKDDKGKQKHRDCRAKGTPTRATPRTWHKPLPKWHKISHYAARRKIKWRQPTNILVKSNRNGRSRGSTKSPEQTNKLLDGTHDETWWTNGNSWWTLDGHLMVTGNGHLMEPDGQVVTNDGLWKE